MAAHRSEEQLAGERRNCEEHVLLRRRGRSLLALSLFASLGFVAWFLSLGFAFFCCVAFLLLSVFSYFDANGHLREVRRRSRKSLVPNFSLLDNEGKPQQPSAHAPSGE